MNEITSRKKDSGFGIGENSLDKDMDEEKNREELVMHEKQLDIDNEQAVNLGGETDKQTKFVSDNVRGKVGYCLRLRFPFYSLRLRFPFCLKV